MVFTETTRQRAQIDIISNPASVRLKIPYLGCDVWLANARLTETRQVDGNVFHTIIRSDQIFFGSDQNMTYDNRT